MKVVLFCGGLGLRMRNSLEPLSGSRRRDTDVPKPLTTIGGEPLLHHVMALYAAQGHRHFVLCLGAGGDLIREWITRSCDTIERHPSPLTTVDSLTLLGGPMDGWRVDLAETGQDAPIGQRLAQVSPLLLDEPLFLANYADGLSDVPIAALINRAVATSATALFVSVPPPTSLHAVSFEAETGVVSSILPLAEADIWINGGFFVLRPEVFSAIGPGEDLVDEPFARLAAAGRLITYPHHGFWRACDTVKDRKALQDLWESGARPWAGSDILVASA